MTTPEPKTNIVPHPSLSVASTSAPTREGTTGIELEFLTEPTPQQAQALLTLRETLASAAQKGGVTVQFMHSHRHPERPFRMHGADKKLLFSADPDVTLACASKGIDLEGVVHQQIGHARSNNFALLSKTQKLYDILQGFEAIEPAWKNHPQATSALIAEKFGSLKAFEEQAYTLRKALPDIQRTKDLLQQRLQVKGSVSHAAPRLASLIERQDDGARGVRKFFETSLPSPQVMHDFSNRLSSVVAELPGVKATSYGNSLVHRGPTSADSAARAPVFHINNREYMLQMKELITILHHAETFAADAYATRASRDPHTLITYLKQEGVTGNTADPLLPGSAERITRMKQMIKKEHLPTHATASPAGYTERLRAVPVSALLESGNSR